MKRWDSFRGHRSAAVGTLRCARPAMRWKPSETSQRQRGATCARVVPAKIAGHVTDPGHIVSHACRGEHGRGKPSGSMRTSRRGSKIWRRQVKNGANGITDPPSPRLRRAKHRRVRAGLALAVRVAASECGQRVSFN